MNLSRSLLIVPAASILLAAAIGSGACSSSISVTVPPGGETTLPTGVAFAPGYDIGGDCTAGLYVAATTGDGFLACDDGTWEYYSSDSDFASDGYTEDTNADGPDSSSDDSSSDDSTSSSDDSTSSSDDSTSSSDDSTTSSSDDSSSDDTSSSDSSSS